MNKPKLNTRGFERFRGLGAARSNGAAVRPVARAHHWHYSGSIVRSAAGRTAYQPSDRTGHPLRNRFNQQLLAEVGRAQEVD